MITTTFVAVHRSRASGARNRYTPSASTSLVSVSSGSGRPGDVVTACPAANDAAGRPTPSDSGTSHNAGPKNLMRAPPWRRERVPREKGEAPRQTAARDSALFTSVDDAPGSRAPVVAGR